MTRDITLSKTLIKKLNMEFLVFSEKHSEDETLELRMRIQNLHQIKSRKLILALRENEDERTFEILLALMGYNKTDFSFREPLKEKVALSLLNADLSNEEFYFAVYSDSFEPQDVEVLAKSSRVNHKDLPKVCNLAENAGVSITSIVKRLTSNRNWLSTSGIRNKNLDNLAMFVPSGDLFRRVARSRPKKTDARRITALAMAWLKCELSSSDFSEILLDGCKKKDYGSIIAQMNKRKRVG